MDNIKEVKKILEEYGKQMIDIVETPDIIIPMVVARACKARNETAQQICQLKDAKCQERVERIFSYIEKQFGGYEGGQGKRRIVIHEDVWQALKKQEQVSNG